MYLILISRENVFSSFKFWNLITAFTEKQLEFGVAKISLRNKIVSQKLY